VFERGYGEEKSKEVEVLNASEGEEVTDGIIEDDDDDDGLADDFSEESEDDEDDTAGVKALKVMST